MSGTRPPHNQPWIQPATDKCSQLYPGLRLAVSSPSRDVEAAAANIVIAIPALNEADSIPYALSALEHTAHQSGVRCEAIVFANNCSDDTASIARHEGLRRKLPVRVVEEHFPSAISNAGYARRMAMELAAARCKPDGIIISTDADAVLVPGAIPSVLHSVAMGADLVCGTFTATLPPEVENAPSIRRINRVEPPYRRLSDMVRFCIDRIEGRQAGSFLPHYVEAGASLAITAALYRKLGGLPLTMTGEDRALVRAAEQAKAKIRYSDTFLAIVSARLDGRAAGGMAETIRARLADPDPYADQALLPVWALRQRWNDVRRGLGLAATDDCMDGRRTVQRLRASDLEQQLLLLRRFVASVVRPEFEAWQRVQRHTR